MVMLMECWYKITGKIDNFWALLGFIIVLVLVFSQGVRAQILQKDSVQASLRYKDITYTTDRYGLQNPQFADTALYWFPFYNPVQQPTLLARQIGNTGQAYCSPVFAFTKQFGFHTGFRQFEQYAFSRDSVRFYTGRYPYAQIKYSVGAQEEQSADIAFAQAINKSLRYMFNYRMLNSPGAYRRQRANHQNVAGTVWYTHKRYNAMAYLLNNAATVQQNGGVFAQQVRLGDTINVVLDELLLPRQNVVPIKLTNAETKQRETEWLIQQTYDLRVAGGELPQDTIPVPTLRVGHALSNQRFKHVYKDNSPPSGQNFYPDFFINPSKTADSLYTQTWQNELFAEWATAKMNPDSATYRRTNLMRLSFTHQTIAVNQFTGQDSIPVQIINVGGSYNATRDTLYVVTTNKPTLNSGAIHFVLQNNPNNKNFRYDIKAKYALYGFNLADFWAEGNFQLLWSERVGGLKGKMIASRLTPDYITEFYFSNHFRWQNEFNKINALQFFASYVNPRLRVELTYANHTFTNYLIWNQNAQPEQLSEAVNISQIMLHHTLHWKNMVLQNRLGAQASSTGKIQLPAFWAQTLYYWQRPLFNNALLVQLGFLFNLHAGYYANAYAPSTGQFYLQQSEQVSPYPVIDVFGAFKIKRVRLYVRMEHVNQGLLPQKGYFTSPTYPGLDRAFRFGASWMFYD